ncbi:hypothetical protein DM02DRAFT_204718 [Periconia macrospinosa]|uniref:Uncharacterized protein n=1 Tax=Periconia macrospinosa TaxID=97972 RepID=A0A2V1D983_9PLEO|nr:hypothetical protein DM02DRAFT_204718 [Periconia macrospinosa]
MNLLRFLITSIALLVSTTLAVPSSEQSTGTVALTALTKIIIWFTDLTLVKRSSDSKVTVRLSPSKTYSERLNAKNVNRALWRGLIDFCPNSNVADGWAQCSSKTSEIYGLSISAKGHWRPNNPALRDSMIWAIADSYRDIAVFTNQSWNAFDVPSYIWVGAGPRDENWMNVTVQNPKPIDGKFNCNSAVTTIVEESIDNLIPDFRHQLEMENVGRVAQCG